MPNEKSLTFLTLDTLTLTKYSLLIFFHPAGNVQSQLEHDYNWHRLTEAYSEPFQTFKMERFAKIVNSLRPLTNFAHCSILSCLAVF